MIYTFGGQEDKNTVTGDLWETPDIPANTSYKTMHTCLLEEGMADDLQQSAWCFFCPL